MKIAVLTSSFPRYGGDGIAQFIQSLTVQLAALGNSLTVIAPFDPAVEPVEQEGFEVIRFRYIWPPQLHIMGHGRALQADVHLNPLAYFLVPLYLLASFYSLMRVTRTQQTDLIHVNWVIPNGPVGALVAMIRRIPFIVSLHGSDIFVARRNPLFSLVARWVFQRAAAVTACSQMLREHALSLGAPEDTHLLPWGVDTTNFHPSNRSDHWRRIVDLEEGGSLLVSLGRMVHKKGFQTLVDALPMILKTHPKTKLIIGGEGPIRSELAKQAEELGVADALHLPGRVAWGRVPELLSSADLFILPSIKDEAGNEDGLPTVLLEAMSCEIPVVASEIGGVEMVINDEKNGLLIPPGDSQTLAHKVIRLLSDPENRAALAKEARADAISRFTWKHCAQSFQDVFAQSIQGSRDGRISRG
jgi:glycosyltransferase involved in cell wall biosynthesis